ncbi:hypothetical protein ABVD55_005134 [Vibrio harveyi]
MEYIGKFGEHFVLAQLLKRDVESYLAIKSNQEDYDITVVLKDLTVKRLQVKATDLQNKNKNNATDITNKGYDYLVLVVIDGSKTKTYVMTKDEVENLRDKKPKLYVSQKSKETGCYVVRSSFEPHLDQWDKIVRT